MNIKVDYSELMNEGSHTTTSKKQNKKCAALGKNPLLIEKELLTHAHYHEDGTIEVNPLLGQVSREESATASGILASYRGRASVNADGTMTFKPYHEKAQRKRPIKVFASAHCTIKLHGNGTVSETWSFDLTTSMSEASILRQREMPLVNEFWANL